MWEFHLLIVLHFRYGTHLKRYFQLGSSEGRIHLKTAGLQIIHKERRHLFPSCTKSLQSVLWSLNLPDLQPEGDGQSTHLFI